MKLLYIFLLLIIAVPCAIALPDDLVIVESQLNLSADVMSALQAQNISIQRYNDTYLLANLQYTQVLQKHNANESYETSDVLQRISDLREIETLAFQTFDELATLDKFIATMEQEYDSVTKLQVAARNSFQAERYEESLDIIERTYEKISEEEALETKVVAFYSATSASVRTYIEQHWLPILLAVGIVLLAIILSYNPIRVAIAKHKLKDLHKRKSGLQGLIKKLQEQYFVHGKIDESSYHLRTKYYGEVARDISRRIPLLEEEIAMRKKRVGRHGKKSKKKD